MFKRNQIQNVLIAAGVTLVSCAVFAQQSEVTTASVTVQNAFTITEDSPLSFGTITASTISGSTSAISLNADGTAGTVTETGTGIRLLTGGTAASYTISGAAPFTGLKARLAADSIQLINPVAPPADPDFTVSDFKIQRAGDAQVDIVSTGSGAAQNTTFDTDTNGQLVLSIGAKLSLPDVASDTLVDGNYEGTYTLIVEY